VPPPPGRHAATRLAAIAADYGRLGYAIVASPFRDDEIESWRTECDRLWALPGVHDASDARVDLRDTVSGRRVPERLDPVIDVSPVFAALSRDDRVLRIVRALLGEEPVLFKDKLIAKTPGTMGYRTHQDFAYIAFLGFPGDRQLAVSIAIDATDAGNGAIEVFGGRHEALLPAPSDDRFLVDERVLDPASAVTLAVEPGDMVILQSLCPHRSAPNRTGEPRRLVFFTYNGVSAGDHYESYYRLGKP
jgi:ectoine hydroxylase-related dioxygenase (phytanoyl-CoA dioxygenase family)